MTTELERKVMEFLKGGHNQPSSIEELGPEGREILRHIARGSLTVKHPKLRAKAIIAIGFDEWETEQTLDTLRAILNDSDSEFKVPALRALERVEPPMVVDDVRSLIRDPATRPDVALAAARIAAKVGGPEIVKELTMLRKRMLSLAPSQHSPSILSLNKLIKRARGIEHDEGGN